MILQTIISQARPQIEQVFLDNPPLTWGASTTGDYPLLTSFNQTKVTASSPTTVGVDCYNHHPHIIEFNNAIHIFYSTANRDEEEPGQYSRYQKSTDGGVTWSSPITLLESQDDITLGWTSFGRVQIPAAFAVADGKLYGVVDVNDKGGSNTSRIGVGVVAVEILANGSMGTINWIENVDGSLTAPSPIATYPSYTFDSTLRDLIRIYFLSNPENRPTWYFSVPTSDLLYTRTSTTGGVVVEPSITTLLTGQYLRIWRLLVGGSSSKWAQTSNNSGLTWNTPYDTPIPDYPSVTKILRLTSDFALIGNNDSTVRSPLFISISSDGLNYTNEKTYSIDTETNPPVFYGIYKDIGCQYPDSILLSNGKMMCVYSVNKEDMRVSLFDIPQVQNQ